MFENLYEFLNKLLGLELKDLNVLHMIFRSLIIYITGIGVILVHKRFIGEKNTFDTILNLIIGSALASGIVGNSPYFATLGMCLFVIFLNWVFSLLSFYYLTVEKILKGTEQVLYKNSHFQWKNMRKHHITKNDLLSEVRKNNLDKLEDVKEAYIENSGEISIVPK